MKSGDIVLINPNDPTIGWNKPRPALVIQPVPPFFDFLLVPITTQVQKEIKGVDILISADSLAFSKSGLDKTSLIQVLHVNCIASIFIKGVIGTLPEDLMQEVLINLASYIHKGELPQSSGTLALV